MENSKGKWKVKMLKEYLIIDIGNELIRRGEIVSGATYDKLEELTLPELKTKLTELMN